MLFRSGAGDEFGFDVSLSSTGQRVVIGGINNDYSFVDGGHVRVYELSKPPTMSPSVEPSMTPSILPSSQPSSRPNSEPSFVPSVSPSSQPTELPSLMPTKSYSPSNVPSMSPSLLPSMLPSFVPTEVPSDIPSYLPSNVPSMTPSLLPSMLPSSSPSDVPSDIPSYLPSNVPSLSPSLLPSTLPSSSPSEVPSFYPSYLPSNVPSLSPSLLPSMIPSFVPTEVPSFYPSNAPSKCHGDYLDITITFDAFPDETSWTLQQDSNIIESFDGKDAIVNLAHTELIEEFCLVNGVKYVWTIFDGSNDGICCGSGEGSYELEMNGVRLASGGDFTDSSEHTFQSSASPFHWIQIGSDIDGAVKYGHFGISVSSSSDGSIIAVGAEGRLRGISGSGYVRVYQWSNDSWSQLGGDITRNVAGYYFGKSVSLSDSGLILAIGAENEDTDTPSPGYVSVYEYSNSNDSWTQKGVDINGKASHNLFGASIQLSEDGQSFIVGGYGNNENGVGSGHVQVYRWDSDSNAWSQMGSDIEGEAAGDWHGRFADISGDGKTVAVGRVVQDGSGSSSGNVRVFVWSGSTWVQKGSNIDSESASDEYVSLSLSSDGNTIAIGAFQNDQNGSDSGHVRVYAWSENENAWNQLGDDIDGESAGDHFGYSVSISSNGHILAVGAHLRDSNSSGSDDSGQVRIFRFYDNAWSQIGFGIDGEGAGDEFGFDVSLSSTGQRVVIGGINNDGNGVDSGHVRVYELSKPPTMSPSVEPSFIPSLLPSYDPSYSPSFIPTLSQIPSYLPSNNPSVMPSQEPSLTPSVMPTMLPSMVPSISPSFEPSVIPSLLPSNLPSVIPSFVPSSLPSFEPSFVPSLMPSMVPSDDPSVMPTLEPSSDPSKTPSITPSLLPSIVPSRLPSMAPSVSPSSLPSNIPSVLPSTVPSLSPSSLPSMFPSILPSSLPSLSPSSMPSNIPSFVPSNMPSLLPSEVPSSIPSKEPSWIPSMLPSSAPSLSPSVEPSILPSYVPSDVPSLDPSALPSYAPSFEPSMVPSKVPSLPPGMSCRCSRSIRNILS